MKNDNILVSVVCDVYNHEPYLRQCFDGFVMQKTNFKFEVLVHDDASTDKSAEIIIEYTNKYPDIFKPIIQKENQYSKGVGIWKTYQFPRVKGKYVAFCEGDDYWTDPLKLQSQVDCLEKDKTFSCCFSSVRWVDKSGIKLAGTFPPRQTSFGLGTITLEVFLKEDFAKGKWSIQLSGFMVRAEVDKTFRRMLRGPLKKYPFGDYPLFITAFLLGNCYFIGEEMSCYRVMSGGYNSQMQANISKAVENQNKIKAAMVDIDNYTKGKYHSCFQKNMLWCDLNIFYMKNKKVSKLRNLLELLKPHYWSLLPYSILSKLRK